jgi:hypothetical protein
MPTELVQIQTPRALSALDNNLDSINEAIATNISGGGISDFDLPRVKISGGASVEAGLTEQQIVDLIVHHRSLYAQKQRTRIDYFQRTIAKAHRQGPTTEAPEAAPDAPEDRPAGSISTGANSGLCTRLRAAASIAPARLR